MFLPQIPDEGLVGITQVGYGVADVKNVAQPGVFAAVVDEGDAL